MLVFEKSFIVKPDPKYVENTKLLVIGGRLQFVQISKETNRKIIIPQSDPVSESESLCIYDSSKVWNNFALSRAHGCTRERMHTRVARKTLRREYILCKMFIVPFE